MHKDDQDVAGTKRQATSLQKLSDSLGDSASKIAGSRLFFHFQYIGLNTIGVGSLDYKLYTTIICRVARDA